MINSNPQDVTQDLQENSPGQENAAITEHPQRIGRYRIEKILGQGGFGLVYLAYDEQLNRPVAIKVPHSQLISKHEDAEAYLAEARTVANLDHPGIVPVYDIGSTEQHRCYVVSKYIEGIDLSTKLKQHRLKFREAAELVATVAKALHYAHKQGLVHRDVKPGNIMIGTDGKPYVVDFGLAQREENVGKGAKYAGTPAYMSPEQARGEGHRVDARSDVFSLGVVFYELLAGRQPFLGETKAELFEQITGYDAKPLRQYDEKLPKELERICYKAMAKRASERYASANDLAEDLESFVAEQTLVQSGASPSGITSVAAATQTSKSLQVGAASSASGHLISSNNLPVNIVPKGLRSFDAHDADFFLELLPGPRDREGLPDSLRFWKNLIEETDPDNTCSVGLIYGPSGCGKSSLVKAGLLPRLLDDVIAVYIEATPEETETRLLHGLRKRCPPFKDNRSLKDTLAALRRGQGIPVGVKVLIVLDQFEQWLHAKKGEEHSDLVEALRQCDGGRLQCIVMVRDDFWMAATRFMRDLEIRLLEGQNSAAVDLFPVRHAEKVLAAFGRAFGTLPNNLDHATNEQKSFLTQSVAGLAEEGKVICVRLALLAEMMKSRSWTPATLKEVGGTKGVGVTFLEETFSASNSPPELRYHQKAARAILKVLLPDSGMDIKGTMRSHAELLEASGYGSRPQDFDDVIRILDSEVRLITPTDPEGKEVDTVSLTMTHDDEKYFQLTHDYLVPSLRDWLTRKQQETRKGRAELRLAERSALWNAKPENRYLPSLAEWLGFQTLTESKGWTATQRTMMQRAARVHGINSASLLLLVLLVGAAIQQWTSSVRWKTLQDQTRVAAESVQNNLGPSVPVNLKELGKLPKELVVRELQSRFAEAQNAKHKMSLAFALANYGQLEADFLASHIDSVSESDTRNFVTALQSNPSDSLASLKAEALTCIDKSSWRRKTKLAIAGLSLGDATLAVDVCTFEQRPDPGQRTFFIDEFRRWNIDLKVVLATVENSDSPALRSAVCLAVGQIPGDMLADTDKEALKQFASQWFVKKSDTPTHSAAGWLLRHWQIHLPEIPRPSEIVPERDWFLNSLGSTMLRLRFGTSGDEFWVADRELTRGQFESFMNDPSYPATEKPADWPGIDTNVSPTADHPAQCVSWHDAVLFCNWLSVKEGRLACYERTGLKLKDVKGDEHDSWRISPGGTGYRLLLEKEWEYACRAGTETEFSSGVDESLLVAYCQMHPSKLSAICGQKLPNAWGLHDFHGNVWEWCWEPYAPGDADGVDRGGCWNNGTSDCGSSRRGRSSLSNRNPSSGFRVGLSPSGIPSYMEPVQN